MSDVDDVESMALIKADIEQARHELQQTVDELADRLNPRKRMDEATEALSAEARRAATRVVDACRQALDQLRDTRHRTPEEALQRLRPILDRLRKAAAEDPRRAAAVAGGAALVLLVAVRHRRA